MMHTLDKFKGMSVSELANYMYNRQVEELADKDNAHYGKRIPYLGWFWRDCDFINDNITIGKCPEFTGIMQVNKWGYPQRSITDEELRMLIHLLDTAMLSESDIEKDNNLNNVWDWFQALKIEEAKHE